MRQPLEERGVLGARRRLHLLLQVPLRCSCVCFGAATGERTTIWRCVVHSYVRRRTHTYARARTYLSPPSTRPPPKTTMPSRRSDAPRALAAAAAVAVAAAAAGARTATAAQKAYTTPESVPLMTTDSPSVRPRALLARLRGARPAAAVGSVNKWGTDPAPTQARRGRPSSSSSPPLHVRACRHAAATCCYLWMCMYVLTMRGRGARMRGYERKPRGSAIRARATDAPTPRSKNACVGM